jgi:hypothetical protein
VALARPAPRVDDSARFAVSVAARRRPDAFVLDGDLGEWGALTPLPPENGSAAATPRVRGPREVAPEAAGSHVVVGLANDGFAIAADLGEEADRALWIGIDGFRSELPPVGTYTQVDGSETDPVMGVAVFECDCPWTVAFEDCTGPDGKPKPFDTTKPDCADLVRKRTAILRAHARRFRRWFRLERGVLRGVADDGSLGPIDGVAIATKKREHGETIEIRLPLAALPRLAIAPVSALRLDARIADASAPPEPADDAWTVAELPESFAFEPMGDLRAAALEVSPTMSYHPTDLEHVETARTRSRTDATTFEARDEVLYRKQGVIGPTEFGYLTIATRLETPMDVSDRELLALRTNGALAVLPVHGAPVAVVQRDGETHLLMYDQHDEAGFHVWGPNSEFGHATVVRWSAIAITPDGAHHEVAFDDISPNAWDDAARVFDGPDSFGVRGELATWAMEHERAGVTVEFRYRWNPKTRTYAVARTAGAAGRR